MKTIELIKKLFELAQLVEDFQIGNVTETSWYDRRTFAYQDVNKFKSKVRTVAEYLEKEINYKGNRPCQRDIDLHNFNTLFSILMESLAKRDCVSYWEGDNPIDAYFALYAICHKMGVELESEEK